MELTFVDGLQTLKLDLITTLALAALLLFIGYWLQSRVGFLSDSNIPAPVIAGLLFALVVLALRSNNTLAFALDSTLRAPLQIAFFTTIGFGATLKLLRAGGWRIGLLLLIASLLAVVQNIVGIVVAQVLGAPAALGIICGALTLTGGPATGLAFAPLFNNLGIEGADALIIASATFGILTASLVGNPLATFLIRRFKLAARRDETEATSTNSATPETSVTRIAEPQTAQQANRVTSFELTSRELLRALLMLLIVMGAGAIVGRWLSGFNITLPAYVGAMILAALVRAIDDRWQLLRFNPRAMDALGAIALALFLALALMDLKLWQLAGLAVPALIILTIQVFVTLAFAVFVTFVVMGRDYEAAITTSGHIGFGLGITPNAVANMEALTRRYADAPRSFLVVPIVGAFFIDFTNAVIITIFLNFAR